MVARALHHRRGARQTHREALTGHATEEGLTTGGPIQHRVAHDDVLRGVTAEVDARTHHHTAARQTLAGVVVGFADQVQADALGQEGAEALTAGAFHLDEDGVVGQALRMVSHQFARQHGAHAAVHVACGFQQLDLLALLEGRLALLDQAHVQGLAQAMVLRVHMQAGHIGRRGRLGQQTAEIQALGLPMVDALLHVQQVRTADQIVEAADTQLRHDLAGFLGHEEEVVHHVLGLATELLAQHRILCGHPHRAGVQVALAHHDAAFDHQGRRGKTEFIGPQERTDHHVAAGLHLAISLHADAAAQTVEHQRLLRLGQAQFPGRARMLDGRPRRSARTAVMAGDHHMVGLALGHTGGNRAHTHFTHQLHADVGARVGVLQVVDELRQVFNRIDVVVRRRADQAHARHRVAQEADVVGYLAAGQLAALAGLGTLGHLDLDLVRAGQVLGGHAKAARGHLLDLGAQAVAFLHFVVGLDHTLAHHVRHLGAGGDLDALELVAVAGRVFTALARVALAADAVHGQGQRGVRLGGDRAQRHRPGGESLDDLGCGLHFVQRNGFRRIHLELEQAAQRHMAAALVVDDLGVFLVGLELARTRAVLQLGDRIRRPHVLLTAHPPGVLATSLQHRCQHRVVAVGRLVHAQGFLGDLEHADAAHLRSGAAEVLVHHRLVQTDGLEELRAAVGHVGAHAHLGHDLRQTLADGLHVVVDGLVGRQIARQVSVHRGQGFHGQVGVHGLRAVAGQRGEVVHLARAAGFHHQACRGAQALTHQVLVHGRQRQQGGNGHLLTVCAAVGDDEDVVATLECVHGLGAQRGQLGFHALTAPAHGVGDVQLVALELAARGALDVAQARHVIEVQHRLRHLQPHRRVHRVDVQQVGLRADEGHQRHHDGLADRIDRRVGHLREQLLEVVGQRLVAVTQHGQGRIVAHRARALFAGGGHRAHQELQVFLGVTKGLLPVEQRFGG